MRKNSILVAYAVSSCEVNFFLVRRLLRVQLQSAWSVRRYRDDREAGGPAVLTLEEAGDVLCLFMSACKKFGESGNAHHGIRGGMNAACWVCRADVEAANKKAEGENADEAFLEYILL